MISVKKATINAVYGKKPDSLILSELCRLVLGREISFVMESSREATKYVSDGQEFKEQEIQESVIGL